jgi:tetratricopeptide (TPR) repeat protein
MTTLRRRFFVLGLLPIAAVAPSVSFADPSSPAVEERRQALPVADAESEYNRGVRARVMKDWPAAESAFRRALTFRAAFPDAWNELGFALRNQSRYQESVDAYLEALRLRPNFPEALEYLGEAYVKMGQVDDAKRVLDQLRPLDAPRAQELAEVIEKGH